MTAADQQNPYSAPLSEFQSLRNCLRDGEQIRFHTGTSPQTIERSLRNRSYTEPLIFFLLGSYVLFQSLLPLLSPRFIVVRGVDLNAIYTMVTLAIIVLGRSLYIIVNRATGREWRQTERQLLQVNPTLYDRDAEGVFHKQGMTLRGDAYDFWLQLPAMPQVTIFRPDLMLISYGSGLQGNCWLESAQFLSFEQWQMMCDTLLEELPKINDETYAALPDMYIPEEAASIWPTEEQSVAIFRSSLTFGDAFWPSVREAATNALKASWFSMIVSLLLAFLVGIWLAQQSILGTGLLMVSVVILKVVYTILKSAWQFRFFLKMKDAYVFKAECRLTKTDLYFSMPSLFCRRSLSSYKAVTIRKNLITLRRNTYGLATKLKPEECVHGNWDDVVSQFSRVSIGQT